MFCFSYLSNAEDTPFEGLKKKKKLLAEIRPLLIAI